MDLSDPVHRADAPKPACNAPFSSAYLDPRGFVRACCMNNDHLLGDLRVQRLPDIWNGAATASLRRLLEVGDLSSGCQQCDLAGTGTRAEHAFARVYDRYPAETADPPYPRQLELALGNHCNLRCTMCNGGLSSSIRRSQGLAPLADPYGDQFFEDLEPFLPHLEELQFLGGEPFLVPAHHRVWDLLRAQGLATPCHVTTNATIWSARVEQVLDDFPVSLAVSLDGITAETVESIRLGARLDTILANLDRFIAYAAERGTLVTLAFSLMTANWHEFGPFLHYANERGIQVFVNRVVHPRRLSLAWCPPSELAEIVDRMEREHGGLAASDVNGHVWIDEMAHLRALADPSAARQGSDSATGNRIVDALPFVAPVAAARDLDAELRDWADDTPIRIGVDARDLITRMDPPDALVGGLAAGGLVGKGVDELLALLYAAFGHHRASETTTGGVLDRHTVFSQSDPGLELRMLAAPDDRPAGGPVTVHVGWRWITASAPPAVTVGAPRRRTNVDLGTGRPEPVQEVQSGRG